jgi:hypothetical protein
MQSTNRASRGANYSRRSSTSGYRIRAYEAHTLGPNTSSVDPDPNSITNANANAIPNANANAIPNAIPNANSNAIPNANTRS